MEELDLAGGVHPKYEQIREALLSYIREAKLTPGDRLPSERQLAKTTGMNRLTVRRAIKVLCDSGVIRQVPKSGTYVARLPEERRPPTNPPSDTQADEASAFMADTSFFSHDSRAELRLHLEDVLPEQRRIWDEILREFERQNPGIVVQVHYSSAHDFITRDGDRFDLGLVTPQQLQIMSANGHTATPLYDDAWLREHPLGEALAPATDLIMNAVAAEGGYRGVPILYSFSLVCVNQRRVKEPLPDWSEPGALIEWIRRSVKSDALCCPFAQSTLNLLVRQNREVITANGCAIDLSVAGISDWLTAKKELFAIQPRLIESSPQDIVRSFLAGEAAACDLQSNTLCLLQERFEPGMDALSTQLQCLQPMGYTQIIPRYLVSHSDGSVTPQTLVLANFLAGDWAQTTLASSKLGLPVYLDEQGVDLFCDGTPLTPEQVRAELARLGGIYAKPVFRNAFEAKTLNGILRVFCHGGISLDQLVQHFHQTTVT